ncbi:hypothetical protein Psi01_78780 [Planobispora siamensis]|uniref:Uncharacterized protein n=1 Tax=Planobispora siamensis TaxID=936338 RepID=A0A8J3WPI0_9ACTN|nr:hypothetical protein Psi01_78780 [Planobispora siamensis]
MRRRIVIRLNAPSGRSRSASSTAPAPLQRRSSTGRHRERMPRTTGRRCEMKKIKIRKAGPVRLTAAACSIYKKPS